MAEGNNEIIQYCERFPVEVIPVPLFTQETTSDVVKSVQAGQDIANRLHYMMNTSYSNWIVLSHLDIGFKKPLFPIIDQYCVDGVGMVGEFRHGLTIVNKGLYDICHLGFWALRMCYVKHHSERLFHFYGARTYPKDVDGYGAFDKATLLGAEMESYGYLHEQDSDIITRYDHAAGQSGHIEASQTDEKREKLKNERLQRKADFIGRYARFK